MRGVDLVGAVDAPRADYAYRQVARFHRAYLRGGRLRAQKEVFAEIEGVLHVARRMVGGDVERLEVIVIRLDLGTVDDVEAHRAENVDHIVDDDAQRMQMPYLLLFCGHGDVDLLRFQAKLLRLLLHRLHSRRDSAFNFVPDRVRRLSDDGTLLGGKPAHLL